MNLCGAGGEWATGDSDISTRRSLDCTPPPPHPPVKAFRAAVQRFVRHKRHHTYIACYHGMLLTGIDVRRAHLLPAEGRQALGCRGGSGAATGPPKADRAGANCGNMARGA